MRSWWFVAATAWALAYLGAYVAIIRAQGDGPALWYVVLLAGAAALSVVAGVHSTRRVVGVLAVACLAVSALLALASIGVLLLPAVALAVVGLSRPGGTPSRSRAGSPGGATPGTTTPGRGSPRHHRA